MALLEVGYFHKRFFCKVKNGQNDFGIRAVIIVKKLNNEKNKKGLIFDRFCAILNLRYNLILPYRDCTKALLCIPYYPYTDKL